MTGMSVLKKTLLLGLLFNNFATAEINVNGHGIEYIAEHEAEIFNYAKDEYTKIEANKSKLFDPIDRVNIRTSISKETFLSIKEFHSINEPMNSISRFLSEHSNGFVYHFMSEKKSFTDFYVYLNSINTRSISRLQFISDKNKLELTKYENHLILRIK